LLNGFLNQPNTRVVAVSDVDTTRREHSQRRSTSFTPPRTGTPSNDCAAYPAFEDLIARKDIDAVVIATPDTGRLHRIAACRPGRMFYCEKNRSR